MQALRAFMARYVIPFAAQEEAVDLLEYALLASFIAVISVASVRSLGSTVVKMYTAIQAIF